MPTALLAEDEAMLRALLKTRLAESWPELDIIGEAANGDEALTLANELRPDIASCTSACPCAAGSRSRASSMVAVTSCS